MIKSYTSSNLATLTDIYKNRKYLLIPDIKRKTIYVALQKGETAEDVIAAYYHAVLLAIAICSFNKINLVRLMQYEVMLYKLTVFLAYSFKTTAPSFNASYTIEFCYENVS